jgi:hypothetical protein
MRLDDGISAGNPATPCMHPGPEALRHCLTTVLPNVIPQGLHQLAWWQAPRQPREQILSRRTAVPSSPAVGRSASPAVATTCGNCWPQVASDRSACDSRRASVALHAAWTNSTRTSSTRGASRASSRAGSGGRRALARADQRVGRIRAAGRDCGTRISGGANMPRRNGGQYRRRWGCLATRSTADASSRLFR